MRCFNSEFITRNPKVKSVAACQAANEREIGFALHQRVLGFEMARLCSFDVGRESGLRKDR